MPQGGVSHGGQIAGMTLFSGSRSTVSGSTVTRFCMSACQLQRRVMAAFDGSSAMRSTGASGKGVRGLVRKKFAALPDVLCFHIDSNLVFSSSVRLL